jgi:hypothetical protein
MYSILTASFIVEKKERGAETFKVNSLYSGHDVQIYNRYTRENKKPSGCKDEHE